MTIRAISRQLKLIGSEVLVFEYLAALYYYGQVWKGTMEKLGEETLAGSKQTMGRIVEKLEKMGLVEKNGMTIRLINQEIMDQIGTKQVQNGTEKFQNGTEWQEKEKKQKKKEEYKDKIKDNNSSLVMDMKSQPQQPIYFNSFISPTWDEIVAYAQEKGMPLTLYTKFYAYYSANGWTLHHGAKMVNWKATLAYWWEKEKTNAARVTYRNPYGQASTQELASYAGAQYADFLERKEREKQKELVRQQNAETRHVSYEEYKEQCRA